jgi:ABC-2 type transport system ATP-binding protein
MAVMAGPVGPAERGAATPAVEVHALTKSYGGRRALEGVDLRLSAGTVLGLLGPNGAGKTTLIRLLSTVLSPDSGSFTVAGVPHTRAAEVRRAVGVLPESAGYPRNQTCEEWLTLHARLFGLPRDEARTTVWRLLDEVGLSDRRGSLIAGLSRGMRQRLGIARALVNDPPVVFLDEPTLGLDPAGQRQVLELITRIAREHGVTVVLSTHVLAEVEKMCDHVVILNRGRVVADGTVGEVTRRAAAPRQGVVRVPPHLRALALDALVAHDIDAEAPDGHRDELEVHLPGDVPPEESSTRALRCLLDAGVPVLGLSLEGGRLSDAFLAVTQGADHE